MNKRVIIDTNVLLNGIFNPKSFSYKILHSANITLFFIENSFEEARKRISEAYRVTGINLMDWFLNEIQLLKLKFLPRVTKYQALQIDKVKGIQDKALAFASEYYDIPICSNDIDDFKNRVEVYSPDKFLSQKKDMNNIFTGFLANNLIGTIYIEIYPNWSDRKLSTLNDMKFYFFDIPDFLSLYIDSSSSSIIFSFFGNKKFILLKDKINKVLKVAISYKNDLGIYLQCGYRGKNLKIEHKWSLNNFSSNYSIIYIGADSNYQHNIYSKINYFCSLHKNLSEKAINKLMNQKTVPLPWERLSLEEVINLFYT